MAGQIIPRGKGKWLVRVFLGRDPDTGKRRYHNHTIHGTKKDAERYLTATLREKDLGIFVEPVRTTLNSYLERWLETGAKPRVRPRTLQDYTWLLSHYVKPELGERRIDLLQPLDIQGLYTSMRERGISGRTIRYTHAVLSSALKQAVRWRLLPSNPATEVDLPRLCRREMRALTPQEATRFCEAADRDDRGLLFVFLLATGMRPSEALGLQWSEVDLKRGTVTVRRTLVRVKKQWHLAEPKTTKSRRSIPLPVSMIHAVGAHRRRQAELRLRQGADYQDNDLVFATDRGAPLDLRNLNKRHLKPILKAAGLPHTIRTYDLRHTCATLLGAAGENPKVISERLGHASVTLTLDTYAHVLPGMQEQAAAKLEAILFQGEG